jgi:hypothetical protein
MSTSTHDPPRAHDFVARQLFVDIIFSCAAAAGERDASGHRRAWKMEEEVKSSNDGETSYQAICTICTQARQLEQRDDAIR